MKIIVHTKIMIYRNFQYEISLIWYSLIWYSNSVYFISPEMVKSNIRLQPKSMNKDTLYSSLDSVQKWTRSYEHVHFLPFFFPILISPQCQKHTDHRYETESMVIIVDIGPYQVMVIGLLYSFLSIMYRKIVMIVTRH